MRDVLLKEDVKTFNIVTVDGVDTLEYLKSYLPSDRVITVDVNNYVYLYDRCFQIQEEDIEEVLND
jgi:hypothetical protein